MKVKTIIIIIIRLNVYCVHFFALAKMYLMIGSMAPEANILQDEMPFSKLNMIKSYQTRLISRIIREIRFDISYIG